MTIDPKMVSHKITKHWLEGNLAYGHIQTLADVYGPQMTRLILQGMEPSFSLRALAPMKNNPQGGKIQNGKAFIICYDWVFYPSHVEAYRDTRSEIKKVNMAVTESANSMICNSKDLIVTESSIIDFVREESKNIKLVSSMFEVATESMNITPDMKYVILKNEGDKIYVSIDQNARSQVSSFMRNMTF